MIVFKKAKDLVEYTIIMTDSNKRFPKKVRFSFVNRMQDLSLGIYSKLLKTNEMPINKRKPIQIDILSDINILLFLVELSEKKRYINKKQVTFWTKLATDVKYMTAAWMNKTK